ncbi:MAG: alginate lyase family protein, partial [Woeseiaceae bacterium]
CPSLRFHTGTMRANDFVEVGHRFEPGHATRVMRSRFCWYIDRLRCMTPAEVSHRVVRALAMHAERAGLLGREAVPAPDLQSAPRPWAYATTAVDAARYLAAADRIAAGKLDVFALHDIDLGSPPRWNRDPKTGVEAPLAFGKLLDYRNPRLVGDIKYLWEVNRHLHLVTLAQAYALSRDTRYFDVIRAHLESWFAACPHGAGPNWCSALEVAIRLINWSVTWQLLGGAHSPLLRSGEGARFRQCWLESVYRHAEFVRGYFSSYSSANNHLIGEAAGLFIAALTWPYWLKTGTWLAMAKRILEREALLQNAPDGVNREQAVSYQHFVVNLLMLCLLAGRANGQWFSVAFESRVEAMVEYLASIMDAGGNVPMFGDSDDALVVRLAQGSDFSPYRSLLATAAILFTSGEFKRKAGALDDEAHWLTGGGADVRFQQLNTACTRRPPRQGFPEGGYYVLGCDFETENEIRLIADAGPLGYRSIAAHGHADALSFTLSVGGLEFLIDPGTYAYHTQGHWRRYFRGTAAHNTLCVDGKDQSQCGGNFMWLKKARAACSLWSSSAESDVFEGWHDGYRRLPDPVMHRRQIALDKGARRVVIEDSLEMKGEHQVELLFHCSERVRVEPAPEGYTLSQGAKTLRLRLPQAELASARVYVGSIAPIRGWISRRFDEKRPAPTIAWRARLVGNASFRSEIVC